jgi:acyl-CoA synthetase (AMP-forming)/AMP-acid ligase II
MQSDLDRRFDAMMDRLIAPGQPLAAIPDAEGRLILAGLPDTLPGFFRFTCAQHEEVEAIVAGEERLSYGAIDALSERLARVLVGSFGIARGDRVAIAMPNCPAWIVVYMAALKAGAIATLVNGWWQSAELEHGLGLTEPALIIADAERARRIAATGSNARIVELEIGRPIGEVLAPLLDAGEEGPLPEVTGKEDATILFTSGSTGRAKGAVSTHRQVTMGVYTYLATLATLYEVLTEGGATTDWKPSALIAVPLFHVTGEIPVMLNSFAIGRKMVLMRKWDAGEALRLIEQERVTYFVGVPTMSLELALHPDREARDISSLADIVAGGAPRPVAQVPRLVAAFPNGHPMLGYGLTETNAVGCTNFRANYIAKPASTGRRHGRFVEVAILGEGDAHLPAGEVGEIAMRAAANFRGYWRDEKATRAAFTPDGYFRTGDLGYLDEQGYLFIVDRAKDIIIRGGENISCQEVEAAIYAHPAIAEASVFGIADERLGEIPAAVVRPEAGQGIEGSELMRFLDGRLAKFKLPAQLWIVAEPLPKLGTGKIDKGALRRLYGSAVEIRT